MTSAENKESNKDPRPDIHYPSPTSGPVGLDENEINEFFASSNSSELSHFLIAAFGTNKPLNTRDDAIGRIMRVSDVESITSGTDKPKLKFAVKRYEPSAFLDAMATPFETPANPDNNKDGVKTLDKSGTDSKMPHCKACTDFKTWMQLTANPRRVMSKEEREQKECPLDKSLLGQNTWSFLHTMAAYYPEKPTPRQQTDMVSFIRLFSNFFPCHKCAADFRDDIKMNPPDTTSNEALSEWFCDRHNTVNVKLGKPEFDCSKVFERWRDGWADNSCD